jgi:photosynthesis system II assembly factor YCF48-like protein
MLCALICFSFLAHAEDRWKMQFFYDKADSIFDIQDIRCPSIQRCIAAGVISDKKDHEKGATVVTSDGGQHWSLEDFAERPVSLFFLNESTGWMVTEHGIWATDESGRTWKKLDALKGIVQVYFLDESHGFAIGYPKAIYETADGGRKWMKVSIAAKPASNPEDTVYDCIVFSGQQGAILGRIMHDERYPVWINPNTARFRRERESTTFLLETFDGGKNWESSTTNIVGNITQMRFSKEGFVVALLEYRDYYALPSAVAKINIGVRGSQTIFGERDRAVKDIALLPGGGALIASVEPPGNSNQVPIPGKLRMLKSKNLKLWEEMDVDYRAVAQRASIAAPDAQHAWVVTDTGMILALVSKSTP